MARNALRKHGRALSAKADAERAELQSQLAGETTQAKLRAAAAEDEKQAFLEKSGAMEEEHEQMRKRLQARRPTATELANTSPHPLGCGLHNPLVLSIEGAFASAWAGAIAQ